MKNFRSPRQLNSRKHRYLVWLWTGAIASTLIFSHSLSAWGQTPQPTATATPSPTPSVLLPIPRLNGFFTSNLPADIARGTVRLDGRKLFLIASPAVQDHKNQTNTPTPIEERVNNIERVLQRIVNSRFKPDSLQIISETDAQSNLPVISISVNGEPNQYLLTITTLDAQINGSDPQKWADQLKRKIEEALRVAQRERQPQFLTRQLALGGGLLLAMIFGSLAIASSQRNLKAQQDRITTEVNTAASQPSDDLTPNVSTAATVQRQMTRLQQRNIKDIQRRFLQIGQLVIWVGGSLFIIGLFPQTRWLQPVLVGGVAAPLKALGIIIGTLIGVRLGAVLIDRFFLALEKGEFVDSESSERLALRFSTFSRVTKGISTVTLIAVGGIWSLSVLGVNIGPLLAGAGIIGLGISLASQNLIKDTINGFFILLEDQYAVGDVIAVGAVSGLVENMNLRITQLRNAEGRLITIPNGSIAIVENLSKDWSRVDVSIDVAYSSDVDEAIALINQVAQQMTQDEQWQDKILEPPQVLGIERIDHTGISIRTWIKTKPLEQWLVAREYRRRLKLALDQMGISIGTPKQSLEVLNLAADKLPQPADTHKPGTQRSS